MGESWDNPCRAQWPPTTITPFHDRGIVDARRGKMSDAVRDIYDAKSAYIAAVGNNADGSISVTLRIVPKQKTDAEKIADLQARVKELEAQVKPHVFSFGMPNHYWGSVL